jgi:DNA (cytosine-5)-methyltransferase 1
MTRAPRLLDLFCGGGGAAMGYHRAGFEVVGVDLNRQPHYPFEFVLADALEVLDVLIAGGRLASGTGAEVSVGLDDVAAIHASPPCQAFSTMTRRHGAARVASHPDLVEPTRARLIAAGRPYVIENVPGAPLVDPVTLCGTMFGLGAAGHDLRRHRLFESNVDLWPPASCAHRRPALAVYGHAGGTSRRDGIGFPGVAAWREGMGIDWMTGDELALAIPPAYTSHLGTALLAQVMRR